AGVVLCLDAQDVVAGFQQFLYVDDGGLLEISAEARLEAVDVQLPGVVAGDDEVRVGDGDVLAEGDAAAEVARAAGDIFGRVAAVNDLGSVVGCHFAALPEVGGGGVVGIELFARGGDKNLIRRLLLPADLRAIRLEQPAEARLDRVDAERIDSIFGAQIHRR